MARKSFIPSIPVKTDMVTRRVQLAPDVDALLRSYCDYYAALKGARPEESVALAAIAVSAMERDRAFGKWRVAQNSAEKTTAAKK